MPPRRSYYNPDQDQDGIAALGSSFGSALGTNAPTVFNPGFTSKDPSDVPYNYKGDPSEALSQPTVYTGSKLGRFLGGGRLADQINTQYGLEQAGLDSALARQMVLQKAALTEADRIAASRAAANQASAGVDALNNETNAIRRLAILKQSGQYGVPLTDANGNVLAPSDPAVQGWAFNNRTALGGANIDAQGAYKAFGQGLPMYQTGLVGQTIANDLVTNPVAQNDVLRGWKGSVLAPEANYNETITKTSRIVPESEARLRSLDAQTGLTAAETNARRFVPFQSALLELNPEGRAVSLQTPPSVETETVINQRTGLPESRRVPRDYKKTVFLDDKDAEAFNSQFGSNPPPAAPVTTAFPALAAPAMTNINPTAAVAQENKLNQLSTLASVMRDAQARVAGQGQVNFNPQGGFRGGSMGGMGGGYYQPMSITNPPLAADELARQLKRYQDAARMMGTLR